ncbi:MAG: glycosyltransferase, partial [Candidatus Krumholzibacteriota bacterium]|nr:glycosyltransferase [Candidatus Krumholzibacteriota bacterium]
VVSFNLIQDLSQRYNVTVLARVLDRHEESLARELERHCHRVVTVMAPNRRNLLTRIGYRIAYAIRSALTRRGLKSLYDCPGAFVRAARALAREPFDLVIVEYWQLYPLFDVFDAGRLVLLTHDIDMLVNRQAALLERHLFRKIRLVRRWLGEQREEVHAYQRVRRILALTERDAAAVRKLTRDRAEVSVLPVGIDVSDEAEDSVERRRDEILFMGAMGAWFNRDAIVYFVRHILPLLEESDARITVVGGELPREVASIGTHARVHVVGKVEDVTPYLARATCIVIPMRFGGGLRVRVLESMAAGLPVICTSVAIAGMDFEPGRDFLLADDAASFAGEIVRLLEDTDLARTLAQNARRQVRARYGRAVQRERLFKLMQDIVA